MDSWLWVSGRFWFVVWKSGIGIFVAKSETNQSRKAIGKGTVLKDQSENEFPQEDCIDDPVYGNMCMNDFGLCLFCGKYDGFHWAAMAHDYEYGIRILRK